MFATKKDKIVFHIINLISIPKSSKPISIATKQTQWSLPTKPGISRQNLWRSLSRQARLFKALNKFDSRITPPSFSLHQNPPESTRCHGIPKPTLKTSKERPQGPSNLYLLEIRMRPRRTSPRPFFHTIRIDSRASSKSVASNMGCHLKSIEHF